MKMVDFYDQGLNMHRTLSEWVVERDGFYYQRTSDVPFNGIVSGNEEGLIGYWNFNEGEGSELIDLSGNGYNGTIYGASWSGYSAPVQELLTPGSVVISEIFYNPSFSLGSDYDYEFLELYNPGGEDVDMSGYYFTQGINHTFEYGTVLPAESFLIITRPKEEGDVSENPYDLDV